MDSQAPDSVVAAENNADAIPTNTPVNKDGVRYTAQGSPYLTIPPSSIKTEVPIFITPHFAGDGPASVAVLSDERVNFNLIMPPWPYTLADAESWIKLQTSTPERSSHMGVLRAHSPGPDGTQIGGVDLHPTATKGRGLLDLVDGGENEFELGYMLGSEWQGKGIMKAAAREMVRYGSEVLKVEIIVRVAEGNIASRKVVEGTKGWERVPERDSEVQWPEVKGGGLRKVLFWRWSSDLSS